MLHSDFLYHPQTKQIRDFSFVWKLIVDTTSAIRQIFDTHGTPIASWPLELEPDIQQYLESWFVNLQISKTLH